MWLHFLIESPEGERSNHSFYSQEFADHMVMLNTCVNAGDQLLSAILTDSDGSRTALPVEAFDGTPMVSHIRSLEMEYQRILNV